MKCIKIKNVVPRQPGNVAHNIPRGGGIETISEFIFGEEEEAPPSLPDKAISARFIYRSLYLCAFILC